MANGEWRMPDVEAYRNGICCFSWAIADSFVLVLLIQIFYCATNVV